MIPVSSYFRNMLDAFASIPRLYFIFKRYCGYTCEDLPDASSPLWAVSSPGSSASVGSGRLSISSAPGYGYLMSISNPANNGKETILEVKAQISAGGVLTIHLGDDVCSQDIQIFGTYAGGSPGAIVNPNTSQICPIDPTTAPHTYKISMQGNTGEIYFDGSPVMTPTAPGSSSSGISISFSAVGSTETADIYPIYYTADLSSIVRSYGRISRRGDQAITGDITLEVDNSDGRWKSIISKPKYFAVKDTEIRMSFDDDLVAPPVEILPMFSGKFTASRFNNNKVDLGLKDKFYNLGNKYIGGTTTTTGTTSTAPVDYSNVNPADLLWDILTLYGGLDSTASTANKDVDYTSWLAWRTYCSDIFMAVSAEFTGQDILTILQSYIQTTNSAVYCENDGKIRVSWWGNGGVIPAFTITERNKLEIAVLDIDQTDLYNQQQIFYGYDPATQIWEGSDIENDTDSQADYGIIPNGIQDTMIWHYSHASAQNLAERLILDTALPAQRVQITLPLPGFTLQIFDGITLSDTLLGLIGQATRLEQFDFDLDKLAVVATGKLIPAGFTNYLKLDDSTLGKLDANLLV